MVNIHDDQPTIPTVADDLARHVAAFVTAFNTGDAEALDALYAERAVLVPVPGHPVSGDQRIAATKHLLGYGVPITANLRHAYVVDNFAMLIVDWSIRGTASDGTDIHLAGAAADVVRRDAEGRWRYLIDNPAGTA
ncbi:YybH family protein [Actinopolymorpha alba]|uniref:YybH family protein n=1 Tax=Actinopolymorpha alba TaxID=533267 RepID=UPI000366AA41|nr:SgcJ/EcaC family oxidoreductase [Actinopolymorpha alba]